MKKKTPFKEKEAIEFWNWFSKNPDKFVSITDNDDEVIDNLLDEILAHLAPFSNELFVYVGKLDDTTDELIISADGKIENFKLVKELVSKAPVINNWKITALIPPKDINGIRFDDLIIPINDLAFHPLINSENISLVNIVLYIKNYEERKSHPEFDNAIERILDLILGEECYEYITLAAHKKWNDEINPNITELREYILGKIEAYN